MHCQTCVQALTCWLLHQGLWQEARNPAFGRCPAAHVMLPAIGFQRQL